jgi:hypothetical protein
MPVDTQTCRNVGIPSLGLDESETPPHPEGSLTFVTEPTNNEAAKRRGTKEPFDSRCPRLASEQDIDGGQSHLIALVLTQPC